MKECVLLLCSLKCKNRASLSFKLIAAFWAPPSFLKVPSLLQETSVRVADMVKSSYMTEEKTHVLYF